MYPCEHELICRLEQPRKTRKLSREISLQAQCIYIVMKHATVCWHPCPYPLHPELPSLQTYPRMSLIAFRWKAPAQLLNITTFLKALGVRQKKARAKVLKCSVSKCFTKISRKFSGSGASLHAPIRGFNIMIMNVAWPVILLPYEHHSFLPEPYHLVHTPTLIFCYWEDSSREKLGSNTEN